MGGDLGGCLQGLWGIWRDTRGNRRDLRKILGERIEIGVLKMSLRVQGVERGKAEWGKRLENRVRITEEYGGNK